MKIEELRCDACGETITAKQPYATVLITAHGDQTLRHYHENDGRGCYRDLTRVLGRLAMPVGVSH